MTFNDSVVEGMEEFTVTLSSVSPDLGGRITIPDMTDSTSVTIQDDDRTVIDFLPVLPRVLRPRLIDPNPTVEIGFEELSYIVSEGGSVILSVSVLSGSIAEGENVEVSVRTMDGSAVAPGDYSGLTETLMFSSDVTTLSFTVPIVDDDVFERDQAFSVKLSGDSVSSVANVATVTINDPPMLHVAISPREGGVVKSSPAGINCGGSNNDCSETIALLGANQGTITLTATPSLPDTYS